MLGRKELIFLSKQGTTGDSSRKERRDMSTQTRRTAINKNKTSQIVDKGEKSEKEVRTGIHS